MLALERRSGDVEETGASSRRAARPLGAHALPGHAGKLSGRTMGKSQPGVRAGKVQRSGRSGELAANAVAKRCLGVCAAGGGFSRRTIHRSRQWIKRGAYGDAQRAPQYETAGSAFAYAAAIGQRAAGGSQLDDTCFTRSPG